MASSNLAEVLFGAYRRRVLALLLLHPDQSFYVRELARLVEVPPGSLHRELKLLAESGLLVRQPAGNQVRYQANRECPVFEDLAGFFRKTAGMADVLREALAPLSAAIPLAFIFGSVAKGKERSSSDVDVMVIGNVSFVEIVEAFGETQQRLVREVNPVVMTPTAFRDKFAQGDRFVTRIVTEPKIFLIGTGDDLAKLTEDRSAKGAPS